MHVKYFKDTDTALLEFSDRPVATTQDVGRNLRLELDAGGHLVRLTIEHAARHTTLPDVLVAQFEHGSGRQRLPPEPGRAL